MKKNYAITFGILMAVQFLTALLLLISQGQFRHLQFLLVLDQFRLKFLVQGARVETAVTAVILKDCLVLSQDKCTMYM